MTTHKIPKKFWDKKMVEWPCPNCGQKNLRILDESFICKDTAETIKMQAEEWFDLEYTSSVFSCMSQCVRPQCKEVVACTGRSGLEEDWAEHTGLYYYRWYEPLSFTPGLKLFLIPNMCPEDIALPINTSFALSTIHPGAAANLIRTSVERLLTAIGVTETNEKGNRINLHNRIEMIPSEHSGFKSLLFAIKFLGNAGSHRYENVTADDLDNSYEIMNFILRDLYSDNRKKVSELANNLDKKFNPQKQKG
ncbi:TPA: DUF4145 domain-containing protein [Escherichia coli]|uniref:DUF4145 domain-containing protein n=2 Tax=Escherichia coli TaxID=562 RepID=UPI00234C9A1F|nr:DUF4145 domain-containing protein [Escherichia coli]MBS4238395.1 DUF4145 domain-containing protein [Escherichia coli]MDC7007470.1 DUF4145 domain-containing protein [Escherichia coli]MDC7030747.1 DUF4145 domain-containing protein [Escherichia coli]HAW0228929.1 DUF4145 domain-containing protein [Escherichia coli]HAW3575460.1 DUF4145 domain-containing protein [Escherichia coli]